MKEGTRKKGVRGETSEHKGEGKKERRGGNEEGKRESGNILRRRSV